MTSSPLSTAPCLSFNLRPQTGVKDLCRGTRTRRRPQHLTITTNRPTGLPETKNTTYISPEHPYSGFSVRRERDIPVSESNICLLVGYLVHADVVHEDRLDPNPCLQRSTASAHAERVFWTPGTVCWTHAIVRECHPPLPSEERSTL